MSFVVGWGDPTTAGSRQSSRRSVVPKMHNTVWSNPLFDGSIPSRPMTKIKKRVDL